MSTLRTLALLAGALLVTSCASAVPATPSPTGGSPVGVTWPLVELAGHKPVDGAPVTLAFADDGAVTGSGGCNRLSGTYEIDGDRLTFGENMASTAMACSEDVMAVEAALLDALGRTRSYAVDDTLTLTSDDGSTLATFAAQAQGLAGTSWVLTGYNNGAQAVVSPILGVEVTLAFGNDGSISGFGGCNRLFGDYTSTAREISFGLIGSTRMACASPEGVMEQEAAFIAALGTAATYTIDGDRLGMRTADDTIAVNFHRA